MADNILSDFGIDILEEEIDDVIFQTNEFLCDATFTGSQGPFWWILQMCMALAALFSIIVAANMAYKMMVKHEPLDVMKLFKPLAIAIILSWWYPPADTGMNRSGSTDKRQIPRGAGIDLCTGHDVHEFTGTGGCRPFGGE